MKIKNVHGIIFLLIFSLFSMPAWSENILSYDTNYTIKIAVTINEDDQIMGTLEYSNLLPLYPLQLVTFNPIGGVIHAEPYFFEIIERTIVSKNVHRIKCHPINDKYGSAEIAGTIDFSTELKPKIKLLNAGGHTYIRNLSENGKKAHNKYVPNIWLGN